MTDWLTAASALIAAVGLIFAGWQSMLLNRQAREDRKLGVSGVVVYWRAVSAPAAADADGTALWKYDVTITNPGRFPIDQISVVWHLPVDFERWRSSSESFEPPCRTMTLVVPVLPGGVHHTWKRAIRMPFDDAEASLSRTYAVVTFNDIDGRQRTNKWPRPGLATAAAASA